MSGGVDYKLFERIEYDDAVDNTTLSNDSEYYGYSDSSSCCSVGYERFVVPLIFCAVVVFGCIGNILVIVVVIRNREQYATTTNIFIVNNVCMWFVRLSVYLFVSLSVSLSSLSTWPSLIWRFSSSVFHFTRSFTPP